MPARALIAAVLFLSLSLGGCTTAGTQDGSTSMGMGGSGPAGDEEVFMTGLVASDECTITAAGARVDGGELVVPYVHAPASSWVVVRSGEGAGAVLGRTAVPKGESRDVRVRLSGVDTYKVSVGLHGDRGVKGTFEFDPERPERTPDKRYYVGAYPVQAAVGLKGWGAVVTPNTALVQVDPQQPSADAVTVRYALTPGPSWIAVSRMEGGVPVQVVGKAVRSEGEAFGVVVPVSGVASGDELLVTVHADGGTLGKFEYDARDPLGSTDQPMVSAGVLVAQKTSVR